VRARARDFPRWGGFIIVVVVVVALGPRYDMQPASGGLFPCVTRNTQESLPPGPP
jgi:hypothetical protein